MDSIDHLAGTFDARREKEKRPAPSVASVARLPRYFRILSYLIDAGVLRISSEELGRLLSINPSLVRQDLRRFGDFGQQGYGYQVKLLHRKLSALLGADARHTAVLVGYPRPDMLSPSESFLSRFSVRPVLHLTSSLIEGESALPNFLWADRREALAAYPADLAILFTRPEVTAEALAALFSLGVRAFLNCTGVPVTALPAGALVRDFAPEEPLLGLLYDLTNDHTKDVDHGTTI